MSLREVVRVLAGEETTDGAGVRLRRSIGTAALDHLDPFLLLDEFRSDDSSDYIAGFPAHPHRGFETVTYMLAGAMRHEDDAGNQGDLVAGSVQWMTAGRGIVHSEMPRQEEGLLWGFQLWVNLPAAEKLTEPRYQDVAPADVPQVELPGGARARVIAGSAGGVEGAVRGIATAPLYLDLALGPSTRCEHPVPAGHNGFVYVYEGAARVGDRRVQAGELGVLGDGDAVALATDDIEAGATPDGVAAGARLLLVAARPIGEPIVRSGPFVMNTREEIEQALRDYREGRLTAPHGRA